MLKTMLFLIPFSIKLSLLNTLDDEGTTTTGEVRWELDEEQTALLEQELASGQGTHMALLKNSIAAYLRRSFIDEWERQQRRSDSALIGNPRALVWRDITVALTLQGTILTWQRLERDEA